MADRKISDLTALTAPAAGDYLPIVDISEASAANKNKRITIEELLRGAPDGTAAAPGIAFESDGGNGMYLAGTDTVGLATNGVARVTVSTTAVSSTLAVDHPLGAAATPSITFTGDLNTGFWSPTADTIAASTGGTERSRIDSSGRLLVGTSSARTNVNNGTPITQIETAVGSENTGLSIINNSNVGYTSRLVLGLTSGNSIGSTSAVSNNNVLGYLSYVGADGTKLVEAARIEVAVDGTPGANDMPGRLVFSTTADGASSSTEAMRINNGQELLIGYTSDNGAYKLQVNSQIFATSATIATSDGRYKENVATLGGCLDLVKALRPVSFTWRTQKDITRTDDDGNEVLVREGHNFPDGTQVGFIAQEVQAVLADKPWLGSVIKENVRPAVKDNEGNELAPEEQFFGIAEGNLIAVLTNALQETVAKIETLEAKVAALEAA